MRKAIWVAFTLVVLFGVSVAGLSALAWRELNAPLQIAAAEGEWLRVPSGTPFHRVAAELGQRGLLDKPFLLRWYAGVTGDAKRVRAGEYQLTPGTTSVTLLAKLVAGDVFLHQITIVEGSRFTEVLAALRSHPAIAATALDGAAIMNALGAPGVHPEGQFFPDTYRFPFGTSDLDVLRLAHEALVERLQEAWGNRSPDLLLKTDYEALILASIIEKETSLPAERKLIAGVFHERLRRNMRLQTDPTVIYGLGDSFDGDLRRGDMDRDTPYNTYTRAGLPPTPIALPGAGSIEAAVAPEITGALYFVATGRGDGSHHFSATFEEHEQALRDYLRVLRSQPQ
ncbi:MAG TPA: endolytic transglycosylase MltG [Gammaproteobacteria bacterium]|nr:endolytic transglycosylase MltG [Gammaproteobacteria bacterium]